MKALHSAIAVATHARAAAVADDDVVDRLSVRYEAVGADDALGFFRCPGMAISDGLRIVTLGHYS
jgi:hypothetical protein